MAYGPKQLFRLNSKELVGMNETTNSFFIFVVMWVVNFSNIILLFII